jgi:hypothetical protein
VGKARSLAPSLLFICGNNGPKVWFVLWLDKNKRRKEKIMKALKTIFILTIGIMIGIWFGAPEPEVKTKTIVKTKTVERSSPKDLHMNAEYLASALYSETKDMSNFEYIAWTIRNRVESEDYPDTVMDVILQEHQFSAFNTREGREKYLSLTLQTTSSTHYRRAYRVARYVLNAPMEVNPMEGVTHFFMEDTLKQTQGISQPFWAEGKTPYFVNGQTKYYRGIRAP